MRDAAAVARAAAAPAGRRARRAAGRPVAGRRATPRGCSRASGVHRGGRRHAGARHRREHRDIQRRERDAARSGCPSRSPRSSSTSPAVTAACRLSGVRWLRDGNHVIERLRGLGRYRGEPQRGYERRARRTAASSPATTSTCSACAPSSGAFSPLRDDVTPGAHPVAVISHDFWRARFGGSPTSSGAKSG